MAAVVRHASVVGAAVAMVVGALMASWAVVGVVHERDVLRRQLGALRRGSHSVQPAVPATPSPVGSSVGPAPGRAPSVVRAVFAARPPAGAPASRPPSPRPTPAPASSCASAAVAVTLPLSLPCNTLTVAHLARA